MLRYIISCLCYVMLCYAIFTLLYVILIYFWNLRTPLFGPSRLAWRADSGPHRCSLGMCSAPSAESPWPGWVTGAYIQSRLHTLIHWTYIKPLAHALIKSRVHKLDQGYIQ
jgi:hypothetical protein